MILLKRFHYLEIEDFKRTPQMAHLNISFTAVNIDKEIQFDCHIDLMTKWKDFQVKKGLR